MQYLNIRSLSSLGLPEINEEMVSLAASQTSREPPFFDVVREKLAEWNLLEESNPFLPSLLISFLAVPRGVTVEPHSDLVRIWSGMNETQLQELESLFRSDNFDTESDQNIGAHGRRILLLVKTVAIYQRTVEGLEAQSNSDSHSMSTSGSNLHNNIMYSMMGYSECGEVAGALQCLSLLPDHNSRERNKPAIVTTMIRAGNIEPAQQVLRQFRVGDRKRSDIALAVIESIQTILPQSSRISSPEWVAAPELVAAIELRAQFVREIIESIPREQTDLIDRARSSASGLVAQMAMWGNIKQAQLVLSHFTVSDDARIDIFTPLMASVDLILPRGASFIPSPELIAAIELHAQFATELLTPITDRTLIDRARASTTELLCRLVAAGDIKQVELVLNHFAVNDWNRVSIFEILSSGVNRMLPQESSIPSPELVDSIELLAQFATELLRPIANRNSISRECAIIAGWRSRIAPPIVHEANRAERSSTTRTESPLAPPIVHEANRAERSSTTRTESPREALTPFAAFLQKVKDLGSWITDCLQSLMDWLRRCTRSANNNA